MAIRLLDPAQHGEKGSPYPFWIQCYLQDEEREIIQRTQEICGPQAIAGAWSSKIKDGYFVAMFRDETDRTLVRLSLTK
jgi:hypothetical protein